jgi:hypothetical protein
MSEQKRKAATVAVLGEKSEVEPGMLCFIMFLVKESRAMLRRVIISLLCRFWLFQHLPCETVEHSV